MDDAREPAPVKLFAGLLAAGDLDLPGVHKLLEAEYGPIDVSSAAIDFTFTDYYQEEMGAGLRRQYVGFANLIDVGFLPDLKLKANQLEDCLRAAGRRRVNIDPGYLGLPRVVLASTKDFAHRIYLGKGVYGEITLLYRRGRFDPLPWTYPDYKSDVAADFFGRLRVAYITRLKGPAL